MVPVDWQAADGGSRPQRGVWPVPVVQVRPPGQVAGALRGILIHPGVSPLAHRGLNEPFGLAVRSGRVGPGADMTNTQCAAGGGV